MTDSLEGQRGFADYLKGELPLNKTQRRMRREKQRRKAKHDCIEHLRHRVADNVEPHGERHTDEWWECSWCGNRFTGPELDAAAARGEQG